MHQPIRKRYLLALMSSDRAVALSLLIPCLMASVVTVFSSPAIAEPSLTQPTRQPVPKPNLVAPIPVAKRLLGQWLTKEPLDGDMMMFVFAPDGKVFIITGTAASGNAIASQAQYRLNKTKPTHLDIILSPDAIVETLFEFMPNGELRLQLLGTRPRKPRPAALSDNATLFQKLSDDTTPPPGTEVKKPSVPTK